MVLEPFEGPQVRIPQPSWLYEFAALSVESTTLAKIGRSQSSNHNTLKDVHCLYFVIVLLANFT